MDIAWAIKKAGAVVRKGPATARNILFSRMDYWPTRRLNNAALLDVPVYCVSLAREVRRRNLIERQLTTMGFKSFEFVDAIVGSNFDRAHFERTGDYDDAASMRQHGRSLTLTEIASSLSHGICYDLIVERGHEIAMVIEDDALFIPSRLDKVDLAALPQGWDIAFLNSFMENGRPRRQVAGNLYHGDAYTGSAAGYFVSKAGVRTLAEGYRPVYNAPDGYTGRNDIQRYMYYPDCLLNGSVCYYHNTTLQYIRPKPAAQRAA